MNKIDPTTLIGRTWGSLTLEERYSVPSYSVLRHPDGCLYWRRIFGFVGPDGLLIVRDKRRYDECVIESVPS